jgi:hypothetical protein
VEGRAMGTPGIRLPRCSRRTRLQRRCRESRLRLLHHHQRVLSAALGAQRHTCRRRGNSARHQQLVTVLLRVTHAEPATEPRNR